MSKEEIVFPIEWWSFDKFKGRTIEVNAGDEKAVIDIPDSDIVCDACNASITRFPCPVVRAYALCPKCQENWCINEGDTEFFESIRYNMGIEEKNPRVNMGGRRKP